MGYHTGMHRHVYKMCFKMCLVCLKSWEHLKIGVESKKFPTNRWP